MKRRTRPTKTIFRALESILLSECVILMIVGWLKDGLMVRGECRDESRWTIREGWTKALDLK